MSLPQYKILPLIPPAQPRLPAATPEYDPNYQNQLNNVLRLYFNQLDNYNRLFASPTGGAYLRFPYGAFHQNGYTTLTAAMTNVSTAAIQVVSTDGFLSAGGLLIGSEIIQYTGKTSTTFTGITRGAYGTTNVAHSIGDYVSEAQPVVSPTTSLQISMTTTDASNGVYVDPTNLSRVYFSVSGYYNIAFSAQLLQFTTSDDNVTFWNRLNGVDLDNSAGITTVPSKHGSSPGTALVAWNFVQPITAGDYVELIMSSDSGNTVCATYPPGSSPVHPASPSIILTATFVSARYP